MFSEVPKHASRESLSEIILNLAAEGQKCVLKIVTLISADNLRKAWSVVPIL